MKYSESEVMKLLNRLAELYGESYPADQVAVERFIQWAHSQYGYVYHDGKSQ